MTEQTPTQTEPETKLEQLSDRALIRRFADRRDERAFRVLVGRHGTLVFWACRHILRHHHDAEDAFQATFLVLAEKAGKVRWRTSIANWLYATACRIALKASARRQNERSQAMTHEPPVADSFEELSAYDAQRTLHEELRRLPDQYRAPVLLCYFEGKTQRQAADELGLTAATVNGRLQRGRHELRLRLWRRGVGLALPAAASGGVLSAGSTAAASSMAASPPAVPESLVTSTLEAASGFAAGGSLTGTGAATSQALVLAKGELAMISMATTVKQAIAASLALAVIALSCIWLSGDVSAQDRKRPATVDTRFLTRAAADVPFWGQQFALAAGRDNVGANAQRGEDAQEARGPMDDTDGDLAKIQGTWEVISVEDSGRDAPEEEIRNMKLLISKDEILFKSGDETHHKCTYKLDPSQQPKWIDLTDTERDLTALGIYQLKGNTLKVCFPESSEGERSTAFESETDSVNDVFYILRRQGSDADTSTDQPLAKRLLGEWRGGGLLPTSLKIKADGTFTQRSSGGPNDKPVMEKGTWQLDGRRLTLRKDEAAADRSKIKASRVRRIQVEGGTLVMEQIKDGEVTDTRWTYHRPDADSRGGTRFGPVRQRTVHDLDEAPRHHFLDLDKGKRLTIPGDLTGSLAAWLEGNGADLGVEFAANGVAVVSVGLKLGGISASKWDSLSPEDLPDAFDGDPPGDDVIERDRDGVRLHQYEGRPELPLTFTFETREGGRGLLRITGYTEDPKGVRLRYKLVQQPPERQATKR